MALHSSVLTMFFFCGSSRKRYGLILLPPPTDEPIVLLLVEDEDNNKEEEDAGEMTLDDDVTTAAWEILWLSFGAMMEQYVDWVDKCDLMSPQLERPLPNKKEDANEGEDAKEEEP